MSCRVLFLISLLGVISAASNRPLSDTADRIKADGYPVESHTVTTEDNYILKMHRIPFSPKLANADQYRPPIFLMHGMLSSSSDWILLGPDKALAYQLADAGFDVWMGNARGNTYSKKHKYYSKYWQIFWNFSWNEIGIYDVPAMIDYILDATDQKQLQFVGHSQGTTVFFVMLSERPHYNDKIISAHLLGPAAYMGNMKSPMTRAFAPIMGQPNALVEMCGSTEFMPSNKFKQDLGIAMCQDESLYQELCANEIFLIGGYDSENLNRSLIPDIKATSPAGASVNQMLHYCQEFNSKQFRKFDYSIIRNPYEYNGAWLPPKYKLKNVRVPVLLYYGENDWLCDVGDVQKMAKELPNLAMNYLVPFKKWSHLDFIWGTDADKYVYKVILQQLLK